MFKFSSCSVIKVFVLGILLDSKLSFDSHITSLCKIIGQEMSALARINHYRTPDRKIYLFGKFRFSYCQLWMSTTQYLSNTLNSIQERALHLIYNDYELPFHRILE